MDINHYINEKKIIMKYTLDQLIDHVNNSVRNADMNISKINNDIMSIEGYSGKKTRHLYNNICSIPNMTYLEVGTWKGSSFVSAIYQNLTLTPIAIENWSQFEGPKQEFIDNVEKICKTDTGLQKYHFIEKDCFQVTESDINQFSESIDIYMYDGEHSRESHTKAITHFYKLLSKYSIIMIDDWRNGPGGIEGPHRGWKNVLDGTFDGLISSPLLVHHKVERFSYQELNGSEDYWNGVLILVCERLDI